MNRTRMRHFLILCLLAVLTGVVGCEEPDPEQPVLPEPAPASPGVFMPIDPASGEPAVVALYNHDSMIGYRDLPDRVVVAVWADGRVVWAEDPVRGGPPIR